MFVIRKTVPNDVSEILRLYQEIAATRGGIIRVKEEITGNYINKVIQQSLSSGLGLVITHPDKKAEIIAEIHAYQYGLLAFRHILTDLTIVVHPSFQGQKIGKLIFEYFLAEVKEKLPHILRVELFVRENNTKAIQFYEKLGFIEEGRHKNKIKNRDGLLETPVEMTWFNPNYNNNDEQPRAQF